MLKEEIKQILKHRKKISETKSWLFESINSKIDTCSQAHQEEKREDPNKIRNEGGKITSNIVENLKTHKFCEYKPTNWDNLEKMNKFL